MTTTIIPSSYGVRETGNIAEFGGRKPAADAPTVDWADEDLAQITRLRFVSDPGFPFWDLSYCWGVLTDGTPVRVQVPFFQLPKRSMKAAILEAAKRDGVFAKGLGVFDAISTCQ